ncbi:MAG: RluA family pseudouridine synthase [bacterium]|nr:RluA family pseudouridine synthase [bacterium]
MSISIPIDENLAGQRLDVFCTARLDDFSRTVVQKAIKEEKILVNGSAAKTGYILRIGDSVSLDIASPKEASTASFEAPAIKIPILYEDHDVVVIDKPPGIAVHAGVGIKSGTIADWFAARYPNVTHVGDIGRAGIVHRLDKDTSGVMILAKNETAFLHLKNQFALRRVRKEYLALVFGVPGGKDGRITRPIMRSRRNPMRRAVDDAGKESATEWVMERRFGSMYALLRVIPFTGRMHQIRVHLHFLGYPIVGDSLYTFKRKRQPNGVKRQLLHAEHLTVLLPNEKRKTFTAPLAEDFQEVIANLEYH